MNKANNHPIESITVIPLNTIRFAIVTPTGDSGKGSIIEIMHHEVPYDDTWNLNNPLALLVDEDDMDIEMSSHSDPEYTAKWLCELEPGLIYTKGIVHLSIKGDVGHITEYTDEYSVNTDDILSHVFDKDDDLDSVYIFPSVLLESMKERLKDKGIESFVIQDD